ncbi:recombination regulator RecX [Spongiibacter taiwanensis]|uniref:regulatory protein RecX n=1 Tax=Spongiibacter taiwanensis TaxID=1748242 RepID=UPI002035B1CF|nr:regulatory protein RecX [Spongiibacter taiwanensis]USA43586.1 recombination regulator RecX [Spongiibacter taiwanensis]
MSLENDIRIKAMDLLARREHSRSELSTKLNQRFSDCPDLIVAAVQRLSDEGLVSNQRFAESFVRQRVAKGHGPLRIRQELRQREVEEGLIGEALAEAGIDWWALAEEAVQRRFGAEAPADFKEKAKRMRFLQQRGFTFEQIQSAVAGQ